MLTAYLITLSVMSLITASLFAKDKLSSRSDGSVRIPETVLLSLTALGGAVGAAFGITVFNHKSNARKKWYFLFTVAVALLVQLAVALAIAFAL